MICLSREANVSIRFRDNKRNEVFGSYRQSGCLQWQSFAALVVQALCYKSIPCLVDISRGLRSCQPTSRRSVLHEAHVQHADTLVGV
jgi:hypothetical protein